MTTTALLQENPSAERRRDPRGAVGESLPLHRLSDDHRRVAEVAGSGMQGGVKEDGMQDVLPILNPQLVGRACLGSRIRGY